MIGKSGFARPGLTALADCLKSAGSVSGYGAKDVPIEGSGKCRGLFVAKLTQHDRAYLVEVPLM
jgi:hypothetical protein